MKRVMEVVKGGRSDWMRETRRCLEWAGIEESETLVMSGEDVRRRVAQVVQEEWRAEMEMKKQLENI